MVSTQGHPADIQRGMDAGVDAYITKPFDPDFMVDTVSEVIEDDRRKQSLNARPSRTYGFRTRRGGGPRNE